MKETTRRKEKKIFLIIVLSFGGGDTSTHDNVVPEVGCEVRVGELVEEGQVVGLDGGFLVDDVGLDDWFQGIGYLDHDRSRTFGIREAVPATRIRSRGLVRAPGPSVRMIGSAAASVSWVVVGVPTPTSVPGAV